GHVDETATGTAGRGGDDAVAAGCTGQRGGPADAVEVVGAAGGAEVQDELVGPVAAAAQVDTLDAEHVRVAAQPGAVDVDRGAALRLRQLEGAAVGVDDVVGVSIGQAVDRLVDHPEQAVHHPPAGVAGVRHQLQRGLV